MCLAVPGKVVSIAPDGEGVAEVLGNSLRLDFTMLDGLQVGDYVLIHAGMAIARIGESEATQTIELLEEMGFHHEQ